MKGRYNIAVVCTILALTVRIVAGCVIKLESMAQLGSNNNIYFMFSLLAFTSFFGKRSIITFVSLFLVAANISFVFIIKELYATTLMNYIIGSTINSTITLIVVFIISYFISRIADSALLKTQNELENNKKLSGKLENQVLELQSMNDEMETMNEDLVDMSRALMASNAETRIFKELADASTQGFIISDTKGSITYTNEAMKELINNDAADAVTGKQLTALYPDEYSRKLADEIMPQIKDRGHWTGELPICAAGGSVIPTLQNIFMIGGGEKKSISYATIVTDLREQKKLEEQLVQAQKMDAVGRLAGGIAHDFNNFLTAITGYSDLLHSQMDADDPRINEVKEIMKAADRSSALTRQILSLTKKQMVRPVPVDLNSEVREMNRILTRTISENIELSIILDESVHAILIDPVQIEQIILNMVINARDSMPGGGKLIIRTESRHFSGENSTRTSGSRPGYFSCLSIEDSGTGIKKENLEKIFEPFFTTKEPGSGTGLGLSITKSIVEKNGGWITVQSETGRGTVFQVYFPAIKEGAQIIEKKKTPINKLKGNGETILIVEDQDEVRKFAATALSGSGYRIFEASTIAEGLAVLEKHEAVIDCIFSDLMLPDTTGTELYKRVKDKNKSIKFILCSGYAEMESSWKEIIDKEYPFIAKPYSLNELLQIIYLTLNS
jgi:two-component system, cell cycle sensor histidine kinase and response regulator CckA